MGRRDAAGRSGVISGRLDVDLSLVGFTDEELVTLLAGIEPEIGDRKPSRKKQSPKRPSSR